MPKRGYSYCTSKRRKPILSVEQRSIEDYERYQKRFWTLERIKERNSEILFGKD